VSELTITTPEHVEIRLEPAGAGSRFLAVLIDGTLTLGISFTIARLSTLLLPSAFANAIFITASFLLTWGWHVWFEIKGRGQTPGKRALSLRVVDARGLPLSIHQALARNIVRVIDFAPLFYGVAAVTSIVDPLRRRLGDIVAGTLVIREAKAAAYRGELAAERRYNTLRTPRVLRLIRHRIGLEERELLLAICMRAEKMSPVARYDLMEEVAAAYRERLDVDEEGISGENFVRDLTSVLFSPSVLPSRNRYS
jgi:uncharacterized RDD family membrane protein YckC